MKKSFIYYIALFLFILTVFPYISLSYYSEPNADDLVYASALRDMGFVKSQIYYYMEWSGRYTSNFFIEINPAYWHWGPGIPMMIIPTIFVLLLAYSIYYFLEGFAVLKKNSLLVVSSLILFIYFSNLKSVSEPFYWYCIILTYSIGLILTLVLWGYVARIYQRGGTATFKSYLLIVVLCFLINGTSELFVFYNGYIALFLLVYTYLKEKEQLKFAVSLFTATALTGLLSLLCPGNTVRSIVIHGHKMPINLVQALVTSFKTATLNNSAGLYKFIRNIPLLLFIGYCAVFVGMDGLLKPLKYTFKPVLLFIVLYVGFVVTYFPMSVSNAGFYGRTFNICYFSLLICFVFTAVYSIGYYNLSERYRPFTQKYAGLIKAGLVVVIVATFFYPYNNVFMSYRELFNGQAKGYMAEDVARNKILNENIGKSNVRVAPHQYKPVSLFITDVGAAGTENIWMNIGYQKYYNIKEVVADSLTTNKKM